MGILSSMNKLRAETAEADAILKQKQLEDGPQAAFGYGGKFGVQTDRFVLVLHEHSLLDRYLCSNAASVLSIGEQLIWLQSSGLDC